MKEMGNMIDHKEGITLKSVDANTPWESIYHSLYERIPNEDVMFYVVQQINLYRELEAYKAENCSANENFIKAVSEYAKDDRIFFNDACKMLYESYAFTADERFRQSVGKIISDYGFNENSLSVMLGYDRTVINKLLNKKRSGTKCLMYALALFLEYDIDQCEDFFSYSPFPLHRCFPDNIFRAYVKSTNRSLQPFIDIAVNYLRKENENLSYEKKSQIELHDFFRPEFVYSYLVVSDFITESGGYDFNPKRIPALKEKMAKRRRTYDDRLIIEKC